MSRKGAQTSTPRASPVRRASARVVSPVPQPTSSAVSRACGASLRRASSPKTSSGRVIRSPSFSQRWALTSFQTRICSSFAIGQKLVHVREERLRFRLLDILWSLRLRAGEVEDIEQLFRNIIEKAGGGTGDGLAALQALRCAGQDQPLARAGE